MIKNEDQRLQALLDLEVLDTPSEKCFDDLVHFASLFCNTPCSAISLIDGQRQWFKAKTGIKATETSRDIAFCNHAISSNGLFVVNDAQIDPRFKCNPLVTGEMGLRFYAGMPITTSEGFNIGAICVLDTKPRELNLDQMDLLTYLAEQVMALFELRQHRGLLLKTRGELIRHQSVLISNQKMASLGELAASIIHEISNPLTIMKMKTESILNHNTESTVDLEIFIKYCHLIESCILRIQKMVTAMRSFSRQVDNDPFPRVSLKKMIENVLQLCAEKIKEQCVEIQLPTLVSDIFLECRETQIEQVFVNLLSNAVDAISSLEDKWIRFEVNTVDDSVMITITDSGKGIETTTLEKIFSPFFTTKSVNFGTGLGLSISRKIVEIHHGSLTYDADSINTRFKILIPIERKLALALPA
jgi:signal transduction histidine kinase